MTKSLEKHGSERPLLVCCRCGHRNRLSFSPLVRYPLLLTVRCTACGELAFETPEGCEFYGLQHSADEGKLRLPKNKFNL